MPVAEGYFPSTEPRGLLGISQRLPPQNAEAEQALLGALLANNRAYERVSGFLRPEHFADPIHVRIYAAMAERIERGEVVDAVTLRTQFQHTGILDEVGGPAYLAQLLSAMVGILNAGEYGRLIVDCALRRELIDRAEELVNLSFGADLGLDAYQIAERHLEALSMLGTAEGAQQTMFTIAQAAAGAIADSMAAAERGGMTGLSLGMPSLDAIFGGHEPGTLHILAGRPGMGKTALGLEISNRIAEPEIGEDGAFVEGTGAKVGIISLEMSAKQIARRLICQRADVHYEALKRGWLWKRQADADAVVKAQLDLGKMQVMIEDAPGLRVGVIAQRARAIKRKLKGLDLLMIDHLHLIALGETSSRHGDTQGISEATRFLKGLSKELGCPILLLAQLNRGLESREDKRPTLADLRSSGSIEQDADTVTFVHRPEYFMGSAEPEKRANETAASHQARCDEWRAERERVAGLAEAIVAKNREGEGQVIANLFWHAKRMRFLDPKVDVLPLVGAMA